MLQDWYRAVEDPQRSIHWRVVLAWYLSCKVTLSALTCLEQEEGRKTWKERQNCCSGVVVLLEV